MTSMPVILPCSIRNSKTPVSGAKPNSSTRFVHVKKLAGHCVAFFSEVGECELSTVIVTLTIGLQYGCSTGKGARSLPPQQDIEPGIWANTAERDDDFVGVDSPQGRHAALIERFNLAVDYSGQRCEPLCRFLIKCGHNRSYLPLLQAESHGTREGGHAPPFKLLVRICNLAGHAVAFSSQIGECELGILIVTVAVALQYSCYTGLGAGRLPPQDTVPTAAASEAEKRR